MKEIFKKAVPVLAKLEQAGFEAYFVGGSVRDTLLERDVADIDIATSAFPEEVKQVFMRTFDTGIEHGTVSVLEAGEIYEITTFRTEGTYADFRRPDEVVFIRSLEKDLERRDFTMNAIAMGLDGRFIDPFDGQKDMMNKQIRAVGEPWERFHEDALRMMRGVRFVSQLGFSLERRTYEAMQQNITLLKNIAIERITVEFVKLMRGEAVKVALPLIIELDMLPYLPGFANQGEAIHSLSVWNLAAICDDETMWLTVTLAVKPDNVISFLRAWKLPTKLIRAVAKAYDLADKQEWSDYELFATGMHTVELIEKARFIRAGETDWIALKLRFESLPVQSRREINVSGDDVMKWTGKKGGPWLKELLAKLDQAVIELKVKNTQADIKGWVEHVIDEST
ncbi:CCA tRNA nucleotidyltransferase [Paenilisteria rocourtiae]|uniref:CCA-adding enzyme n=1 Tax=Listeria rocourtiae TaxID=647910 RepID=A0A4R6ZRJ7_9LIST|nr:CCA tRNA nucleotidyltransferase [Listeria rocourtiae]EUJ49415.1 tRNA CCA-pyrophosphorylase [Listeria rocourtiae FSL F6-920]MBC1603425.1 CCA tRNA nucleotidyltransferase [Listeria rocourtiae]TDR55290.1 tRNA nucleotidyltransferase (CCA-adding enzyme) [Listeria rocourtiae]